jgi:hypothetical protein
MLGLQKNSGHALMILLMNLIKVQETIAVSSMNDQA